ncbi:MAG: MBL fold metallo-hydrolase [Micromonosporaceae bacterium]|nr:MBL fold metallo-hydrolase [Micromonosporaceae bacterium]
MSYTGNVTPGGPPQVRELADLVITKLSVGPMDNNVYLLRCKETGDQILIDAAAEPDRILDLIGHGGLSTVVTTHRHRDHWGALADVVTETGAMSVAHAADAGELPVVHATVADGDHIEVGDCQLEVIHLVGHTPGSIALLYRDPTGFPHLFTGDSLFPGGVGNTRGNPADFASLINDVERKLFDRLPDETWFYPGHGRDSTLGAERPSLPDWRARGW